MAGKMNLNPANFRPGKYHSLVLFAVFMIVCFGLGYSTLNRYDPRIIGDPGAYYKMARFDYAEVGAPHRFRIATPVLAGMLLPVFSRFRPGTWDPVVLSFLIVNSLFASFTALMLVNLAGILKPDNLVAILSPFIYLSSFTVVNGHLAGLVDAGEAFFITALILAIFRNRWFLAPILIAAGALNKEATAVFGITYLITWWMFQHVTKMKQGLIPVICIFLSAFFSVILIYGVRTFIGGQLYETHKISLSRLSNLLPGLVECLKSKSLLYSFLFLLPIGVLRLKEFPLCFVIASLSMGLAAIILSAYAELGENVSRPLFNTIAPMLAISCAIFLRDSICRTQREKT